MQAADKRHALTFVTITVFIDVVGFGIVMPVLPDLLKELASADNATASIWAGWLVALYAILQFLVAPLLGNLSDRFGRRPLLLVSLFMYGVNYLIAGFATALWVLFIGRILTGRVRRHLLRCQRPDRRCQPAGGARPELRAAGHGVRAGIHLRAHTGRSARRVGHSSTVLRGGCACFHQHGIRLVHAARDAAGSGTAGVRTEAGRTRLAPCCRHAATPSSSV